LFPWKEMNTRVYPRQRRQKKGLVDGKNSFNVSIGLASVQVTYALLHLREIPRFVNPQSKGIASTSPSTNLVDQGNL
jgi:hypothetical protein